MFVSDCRGREGGDVIRPDRTLLSHSVTNMTGGNSKTAFLLSFMYQGEEN